MPHPLYVSTILPIASMMYVLEGKGEKRSGEGEKWREGAEVMVQGIENWHDTVKMWV